MFRSEDVPHQAEAFLAYWVRLGGDRTEVFERWANSKDLAEEDRRMVWEEVQELIKRRFA